MLIKPTQADAKLGKALEIVLANTYVLAVETHGYHWNVIGEHFLMLHDFFGKQYEALFHDADRLAERLRALGFFAPQSMKEMLEVARVKEAADMVPPQGKVMVADLMASHQQAVMDIKHALAVAEEFKDAVTADLLTERLDDHDKTIWMLSSILAK